MKQVLPIVTTPTADVDPLAEGTIRPFTGKKVHIENYGCQMNLNDSEIIHSVLDAAGYEFTDRLDEADIILMNTCAVREHAEERVFGRLAELSGLKHRKPDLVLGVCGCMAQHLGEQIPERAPYVDLVMGPDSYRNLPAALEQTGGAPVLDVSLNRDELYDDITPIREEGVKAWLTIQRGCDKFCTFCIVPFVRGRERSIPLETLVEETQRLAERGVKEVTLLGQTVNSYHDGEHDFATLLEAIAEIDGIERVRFTSPHPSDATDGLIRVMASNPKVCQHLHLPIQSGSNEVLKRMRRTYSVEDFLSVVDALRDAMPRVAITTDIIVGFPGESLEDFAATLDVMERVRFDSAFMFKYSPRPGTVAHKKYPDDIPEAEKVRRLKEIIALQEAISAEVYADRIGSTVDVLVEGESKRSAKDLFGKTDDFKTCVFPRGGVEVGEIVTVRVVDATSHTLIGRRLTDSA